jgi:hypothetical protein
LGCGLVFFGGCPRCSFGSRCLFSGLLFSRCLFFGRRLSSLLEASGLRSGLLGASLSLEPRLFCSNCLRLDACCLGLSGLCLCAFGLVPSGLGLCPCCFHAGCLDARRFLLSSSVCG